MEVILRRLFTFPSVQSQPRTQVIRPIEWLPWVLALMAYFVLPTYMILGSQIFITILFALSLDLILGYAGIITLGHAVFFGIGAYTAGLLALAGYNEPVLGLLVAAAVGAAAGVVSGVFVLRTLGFSLIILTLLFVAVLHEAANKANFITGGVDGLQGVVMGPVLGAFAFDLYGRVAYLYSLTVLFICWYIVRRIVHSPFGLSLIGIRENQARMRAVGTPVFARCMTAYTISAAMAGVAGALLAQTTEFVSLDTISVERSGIIITVLILGGVGRIYGAFVGGAVYMIFQDQMSAIDPMYWSFWIGLLLVLVVMFARGGILGVIDKVLGYIRAKR